MAYTTLDQVLTVIDRLGMTRMAAFDGDGHTIDTAEVSTDTELMELVEQLVANNSGTIRLECWQAPHPRKAGETKAEAKKVERLSWRVRGTFGTAADPGSVPPAPAAVVEKVVHRGGMDVETAVAHARMEWTVEALRAEVKQLREEDTDEEDDAPAPALPSTLFGMSGEQTFQLLSGLRDIVVPLLSPGGRAPQAIGAAPAPQLTAQELELFQAFRKFGQEQPDEAKGVIETLMSTYGPNAKPQADAKG